MKIRQLLFILIFLCLGNSIYALDNANNTVTIKLINHSKDTLNFEKISKAAPGNVFSLTSNEIPPGGSIVITGIATTRFYDLVGEILFKDARGNGNLLKIVDYHQTRAGQPVFTMHNSRFISFVVSQSFNDLHEGPNSLSYKAAEIEIQDNLTGEEVMA